MSRRATVILVAVGVVAVAALTATTKDVAVTVMARGLAPRALPIPRVPSDAERRPPGVVADPLQPHRPPAPRAGPAVTLPAAGVWPLSRPERDRQYSRSAKERGVLPCEAPDPGLGSYAPFVAIRPRGQLLSPRTLRVGDDGQFDLLVHFHGHRPARKELVRSGVELPLLGVSLGIGAAYGPPFADGTLMPKLVVAVEKELSRREGRPLRVRRLALSGWSRGFEAVAEILKQPIGARVDAVILLDSLHAGRDPVRGPEALAPFSRFAARAVRGETLFFVSHSAIDEDEYATTTETARYLVAGVSGALSPVFRRDPLGLELFDLFSRGSFHVRGYAGNGKLDHCAHFGLYPMALFALNARWRDRER